MTTTKLTQPWTGRILVIRGGAIGDFILTLPVLAALRARFPGAGLEVLGYQAIASLALLGGLADAVRSIDARPLAGFFAANNRLDEAWQRYFAGFDIILSFLYDPDGVFEANVRRSGSPGCQFLAGPHRPDDRGSRHACETFLQPLERLAIFDPDPIPRLRLGRPESNSSPTIALHPGSGSEQKNWPEERWGELLGLLLARTQHRLLLIGGEAEGDRLQRLARPLPADRVELAQHIPLPVLAQRLAGCRALIGHDSGISHLAAAVGRPVIALWGNTVETVWRPRGEHVRVLRGPDGLASLPAACVFEALEAMHSSAS